MNKKNKNKDFLNDNKKNFRQRIRKARKRKQMLQDFFSGLRNDFKGIK